MHPDYLEDLAYVADPDELWRLSFLEKKNLPPDKLNQLHIGIALRRYANFIRSLNHSGEQGKIVLITAICDNGVFTEFVETPEKHKKLKSKKFKLQDKNRR